MEKEMIEPYIFDNNRIERPYIGGERLNKWRRMEKTENSHHCEELLVSSIGAISKGKPKGYAISKTIPEQGSISLNSLLDKFPNEILGPEYNHVFPNQLKVLARVGDTIVKLVLQCHPRKEDAIKYFNEKTGKTEAWYIVAAQEIGGEKSHVYAGFKPFVTREYWKELFKKQDVESMVACLHKIYVKKGDVLLIPAGMPHAVGPGCLFLELHECSDITIRVERKVNGIYLTDEEMFNGLKSDEGLELFDYSTYTDEEIHNRVIMQKKDVKVQANNQVTSMINSKDTNAFGMEIIDVVDEYTLPEFPGHRILIPIENDIEIVYNQISRPVTQGWGVLIPSICKGVKIKSEKAKILIGLPTL